MRLSSFWSNIGRPRVKETSLHSEPELYDQSSVTTTSKGLKNTTTIIAGPITPATNDLSRTSRLDDDDDDDRKSFMSVRSFRKLRSLKISRRKSFGGLKTRKGQLGDEPESTNPVPVVPKVPLAFCQQPKINTAVKPMHFAPYTDVSPIEEARPGTAITTQGSNAVVWEVTTPVKTDFPTTLNETPPENTLVSPVDEKPRLKRASWFECRKPKTRPTTAKLPPKPPRDAYKASTNATSQLERHDQERDSSELGGGVALLLDHYSMPPRRSNSDNESIIQAFPSVPPLVHDNTQTPKSSNQTSGAGDSPDSGTLPLPECSPVRLQRAQPPTLTLRENIYSRHTTTVSISSAKSVFRHGKSRSSSSSRSTVQGPRKDSRLASPRLPQAFDELEGYSTSKDLEDWDKISEFMELMDNKQTSGAIEMLSALDIGEEKMPVEAKFRNSQALAALEFGALDS